MSLAAIRSIFERELFAAFDAESVPVVFDNVQEEPPAGPDGYYAIVAISFPSITVPVVCREESMLNSINGSIQVSVYGPRATGMKRIEQLAEIAAGVLCRMKMADDPDETHAACGAIDGPITVLSGNNPMALVTLSAPFTAKP